MTRIKYNFDEEKLLRLFTSSSDFCPAFMNPFEQNGYIWSTDRRSLIRIIKDTLRGTYNHLNKPDATKAIGIGLQIVTSKSRKMT